MLRVWILILIGLGWAIPISVQAQSKAAIKKAKQLCEQGFLRLEEGENLQAMGLFREAISIDSNLARAWAGIGAVQSEHKQHEVAVQSFLRARRLDPTSMEPFLPTLAEDLAGIGSFSEALSLTDSLMQTPLGSTAAMKKYLEKRRTRYLFGVNYQANRTDTGYRFEPQNLGPLVNSRDPEYLPSLTIDGSQLAFTRNRGSRNEDFFASELDSNGKWKVSQPLPGEVNTPMNEGAMHISQDGEWMVFAACSRPDGYGGCDLYISYRTPSGWTPGINLGGRINTDQWETQPCLSPDKQSLYFVSRRPGGLGGSDIYVSRLLSNGRWDDPLNLGPNINTSGDEQCPFLHADNQTLYFTSPGWPGYGNDDLFLSRKQPDGSWSKPENLGFPINTIDRDGSLIIAADGITAYYASNRSDSYGEMDLYQFSLPKHARSTPTYWIRGNVTDSLIGKPIAAILYLREAESGNAIKQVQADTEGNYLVTLPAGTNYLLTIRQPGYFFHSEVFEMKKTSDAKPQQLNVRLRPLSTNASVVLKHVYFRTNRAELADSSRAELMSLVELLQENPGLIVEIGGHTDNQGSASENLSLSKRRAEAVVHFLTDQGIPSNRLQAKGYGAGQPIADNSNAEGRAKNRRSEMKIIRK
ncbi:MAG: flagellar motor protein MotB [Bacteroidetes bacterium]|nr:flagellar motor protein MotB [Bacteroidota bacterium]